MTRYDDDREIKGEVQDEGVDPEILQDKMVAEDVLRQDTKADRRNPNDQPGFMDGIKGDWDGEVRQGDPNNMTGSDLGGEEHGGEGTERSGGVVRPPCPSRPTHDLTATAPPRLKPSRPAGVVWLHCPRPPAAQVPPRPARGLAHAFSKFEWPGGGRHTDDPSRF